MGLAPRLLGVGFAPAGVARGAGTSNVLVFAPPLFNVPKTLLVIKLFGRGCTVAGRFPVMIEADCGASRDGSRSGVPFAPTSDLSFETERSLEE
jgi:hypothetical protein